MIRTGLVLGSVIMGIVCAIPASAAAQTSDARGRPGLLGRTPNQDLEVTISASGAYDDSLLALVDQTLPDPRTQVGGAYQALGARIQYRKKFRYARFDASESSTTQYYPSLTQAAVLQHSAVGAFTVQKGLTTVAISQTALYSPFYSYSTLPSLTDTALADLPTKPIDQAISLRRSESYGSTALLSQGVGRRVVVAFSATYQGTKFDHETTELQTDGGAGRLTYRLGGGLGLVAGYGYQEGRYRSNSLPSTVKLSTIDVGLTFNRALSVSRKTTFAFESGTTAVADSTGTSAYRVIGNARLNHQFARTWHASASYTRGVGFIDGLQVPTFSNALSTGLAGKLSRRIDLSLQAGYSRDQIGIVGSDNLSNTYSGSETVRIALSPLVSMSVTYATYKYRFDQDTALPAGVPPQFHREELRAGLDLWLPLIH